MPPFRRSFFARDAVRVARELVGAHIVAGPVRLRITETEAYMWPGDSACHARAGKTRRNAALWGPPGRAYVYTCYGLHQLLNLVTGEDGQAQAVLIRSCEVVEGIEVVCARRGAPAGPSLLAGPGKVGQALAVDPSFSHRSVIRGGPLWVGPGTPPARIACGPRIGIGYADPEDRVRPWRFAEADSPAVTFRRKLRA
ncbi:MAG: DNA-3-methyladenine glycosylase [Deltaproteobacteria bacterium]|nr:MAG: DNA-3-methyladenine glycosylase [Deltaproteobacteria bacterium]